MLESIAALLDMKNLKKPPPELLSHLLGPETWRLTKEYNQSKHQLSLVSSGVSLIFFLLFWFLGGFNSLDQWVAGWHWDPIIHGVLFMGLLLVFSQILGIPFDLYRVFVLEERFGFNKTTWKTYWLDFVKMLVLGGLLGGLFLAGVLAFFDRTGDLAWAYCWLAATLFTLAMQMVVPRWIMPLFNRFSPLADGELRQAIEAYAKSVSLSLEGVFEMDGSKRSTKANAFVSGFGRSRRIALFDTLIQKHSTNELVAVLAHEIGHFKKRHQLKTVILGVIHMGLLFYLLSLALKWPELYRGFFMDRPSIHSGLVFFSLLIGPLDLIISLFFKKLSRTFEFEADQFAVETVSEPAALVHALEKLTTENLSNLTPHPFFVMLHHSHPPLTERINAMKRHPQYLEKRA